MNIIVRDSTGELRAAGRKLLHGNWAKVTLAMFIWEAMIDLVPSIVSLLVPTARVVLNEAGPYQVEVSYLSNLYSFALSGAFALGLAVFLLSFVRSMDINPGYLFYGFEYYIKAFLLSLVEGIIVTLWTFLFIIPGIIALYRYSQAYFILADDPSKGIIQCLRESKYMMVGNKGKLFLLQLSFVGWIFLSALPAGIFEAFSALSPGVFYTASVGAGSFNILGLLVDFVFQTPLFMALAYMMTTSTVFYEIASGHMSTATGRSFPDLEL